ncbi:hypothetical protein BVRB_038740 [Beta vulgaris subsp. vulgaris]|uniref:Uncharacterized protein n=1 Tax=Beta vulgaris subsp. vulgaris TaxID=3555 RepID=A0A0J7YNL1_BETVV|nr:hypothetical protein BVRB_038740 [Beta vulgaris subsp. vulgaris]
MQLQALPALITLQVIFQDMTKIICDLTGCLSERARSRWIQTCCKFCMTAMPVDNGNS